MAHLFISLLRNSDLRFFENFNLILLSSKIFSHINFCPKPRSNFGNTSIDLICANLKIPQLNFSSAPKRMGNRQEEISLFYSSVLLKKKSNATAWK